MKLYIKQKVFSWGDKFTVCGEDGAVCYTVEGEVFSFGKKLHVLDPFGEERAFIHQKLFSFLPCFYISIDGGEELEVTKRFFFNEYNVGGLGWKVLGNFMAHEYDITDGVTRIASVSKEWFTWGDSYVIDTQRDEDELCCLCVLLVIDAIRQQQSNAAAASSNS